MMKKILSRGCLLVVATMLLHGKTMSVYAMEGDDRENITPRELANNYDGEIAKIWENFKNKWNINERNLWNLGNDDFIGICEQVRTGTFNYSLYNEESLRQVLESYIHVLVPNPEDHEVDLLLVNMVEVSQQISELKRQQRINWKESNDTPQ